MGVKLAAASGGSIELVPTNTASAFTVTVPASTTTMVGTDATQTLTNKTIQGGAVTSGTAVASTSGTSIDFTSIPSWVKKITVMFAGVSTNGSSALQIQIGTSGGVQTTNYLGSYGYGQIPNSNMSAGFTIYADGPGDTAHGSATLSLLNSSTGIWTFSSLFGWSSRAYVLLSAGSKTLSGTLDRVRITTVNGTDTFDAGSVNILYEG